jgi:hypothetical protein
MRVPHWKTQLPRNKDGGSGKLVTVLVTIRLQQGVPATAQNPLKCMEDRNLEVGSGGKFELATLGL